MIPHEFQRAGLAYSATDITAVVGHPGTEAAALAHCLQISERHWYKPLALRGYAVPWFFLHDVGVLVLWGQPAIRPHAAGLGWNAAQQVAYDDYAAYLGRLARIPLLDSIRRWLRDLSAELLERGHGDEVRAYAELQVTLAALEWLLDTIEPVIGWRRLATDLRWQGAPDADSLAADQVNEAAAANLRRGLTPDGETPPERPFLNFLRQVIGTGELLWKPGSGMEVTRRRWFNEIAIRASTDFREAVRPAHGSGSAGHLAAGTPLERLNPAMPLRTRALRPLDTVLIERYLNRAAPISDKEIQMELDYTRQDQLVDVDHPMHSFPEGVNGVTRRGPIHALVRRELTDDDLFYAKFADNSLLYHNRPELMSVPHRFFMGILVDTSFAESLPDGTAAHSVAKELALYLLDTARLIPTVARGLPTDGYLFQFGNQGAEYQGAPTITADLDAHYARQGVNLIRSPYLDIRPGEFLLNLNDPPGDLHDPWLLRSDALAASYFNLSTLPGRDRPPITAWDSNGVVYPAQPPHTWDIGTPTRQGSHLTGQLTILTGESAALSLANGANGTQPVLQVMAARGRPMSFEFDLPAGSTFQLGISAAGRLPTGYRLNLRFAPGARSLHIGPHLWPAVSRLAHSAAQLLVRETDTETAYSLAHLVLITSDALTQEMADQIQSYIRGEFEAIARRVAIHIFRLSPPQGTVSWLLDRGQWHGNKPPQSESLDTLRGQSRIRIQFWRELRRDLESLDEE